MKINNDRVICFLLPMPELGPIGGYKIVYEYANRLVGAGYSVFLAYALSDAPATGIVSGLIRHPIRTLLGLRWRSRDRLRHHPESWFVLDGRVRKIYPISFSCRFARKFPVDTCFIATAIWTAERLNHFSLCYKKIQFIQGYEAWNNDFTPEMVADVYRYPMTKIAIAEWLCQKVQDAGACATYVPNGLDFEYFKRTKPIEERSPTEVALLWHLAEIKGLKDALAALQIVKGKFPNLHVTAFGTRNCPDDLPNWFSYVQRPNCEQHNAIYNNASIFVASSLQEGWGLTPCEAMQCGAAVACTDIGGYRSFAHDGETALMSPVHDPQALAANIIRLIEDSSLRYHIANAGHENVQRFTWEKSLAKFQAVLATSGECL